MVVLCASASQAETTAPEGTGDSYWGPIPPPSPAVVGTYHTRPRAAWEWPLYGAYRAVGLPIQFVGAGLRTVVIAADRSGLADRLELLFGAVDLPYGFRGAVDFATVAGGGAGLTFYHEEMFGGRSRLQLKSQFGNEGRTRFSLGLLAPRRTGFVDVGGGYTLHGNARFFGLGPNSHESDKGRFTEERAWLGATLQIPFGGSLALEGTGFYSTVRNRGPRDDTPTLADAFVDRLPPGYGVASDGFDVSVSLLHDNTDTNGRPAHGGVHRFKVGWFAPTTDDHGFLSTRAELQQFFGLWRGRTLAVRGAWGWLDSDDHPVHFQRQFRTDTPDEIRGFSPERFRGSGISVFSAEYRFPSWSYRDTRGIGIDTYLFFDWGQVFDARRELALRNFREGYGAGFRWISRDGFGGRLELAFSEEEVVLRLRTDQGFQYAKHGFYHGRIPIPSY